MKHTLNIEERNRLDQHIADAEKRTGAQIVLAIIERSDSYAELPWKAFALGASLAGLVVGIMNLLLLPLPLTSPVAAVFPAIVMMLAAGAGLALLCIFVPDFARLFLNLHRADVETRQYAESLFLSRQLFATHDRKAVLLLLSLFERRIVVLPDAGLTGQLNREAVEKIIAHMRVYLKAGKTARALDAGIKKLEEMIAVDHPFASVTNELSNEIIEEKGV
jgi:putative membrane protein